MLSGLFTSGRSTKGVGNTPWGITVASNVAPIEVPLPALSTWESRMVTEPDWHGVNIGGNENDVYYDFARVCQLNRDYAGNANTPAASGTTWTAQEDLAVEKYTDIKFASAGNPDGKYELSEGWWAFPHGLYYHYNSAGTNANTAYHTLIGYGTNANSAYQNPFPAAEVGESAGWPNADGEFHPRVSRENAYYLQTYIYLEKIGYGRMTDISEGTGSSGIGYAHRRVEMAAAHLRAWKNNDYTTPSSGDGSSDFMQVFMVHLTLYALKDVVEHLRSIGEDENQWWPYPSWQTHIHDWPVVEWPTIVDAIYDMTKWLFQTAVVREPGSVHDGKRLWIEELGLDGQGGYDDSGGLDGAAFRYVDKSYSVDGGAGSPDGADPDLALLIIGHVSWIAKEKGDSSLITDYADKTFQGGANYAYMEGNFGKAYNQCYLKSHDYIKYRNEFGT